MADNLKEYIVTLRDFNDLDKFYEDMESPGGNLYIPSRCVDVANRRPISRNTHYYLTSEEVENIKKDPRVLDVQLNLQDSGIKVVPTWTQTGLFSKKNSSYTSLDKNWGLLRGTLGSHIPGWGNGVGGTSTTQNTTISRKLAGKHVDVVIVDGIIKANHAEFKTNIDGTGASRINQYNWFQLNPIVNGTAAGTYNYVDTSGETNHGTHVAGIAVGNTQGWARNANIYNISPYGDNSLDIFLLYDYIRAWHKQKPINPLTGLRNPTITNNSYGFSSYVNVSNITEIIYRGTIYGGPWNSTGNGTVLYTQLGFPTSAQQYQLPGNSDYFLLLYPRIPSFAADVQDAINDGIHVVWAAGNNYKKLDVPGGLDYDNRVMVSTVPNYINRPNVDYVSEIVNVGAISADYNEIILWNKGPAVDIWAPGAFIMSSIGTLSPIGDADDPRNLNGDRLASYGGTSMAAPQVAGIMASMLEASPNVSTSTFKSYLQSVAKDGQLPNIGTGEYTDFYHLLGAPNKVFYLPEITAEIELSNNLLYSDETLVYGIIPNNAPSPMQLYVTFAGTATQGYFVNGFNNFTFEAISSNPAYFSVTTVKEISTNTAFQIEVRVGGYTGTVITTSSQIVLSKSTTPVGSFDWGKKGFLGTLTMWQASELSVDVSQTENLNLVYNLKYGTLPTGLTLNKNGSITGVVSTSTAILSTKIITTSALTSSVVTGTSVFYLNSSLSSVFNLNIIKINDTVTANSPGVKQNTKISNISTNSFTLSTATTSTLSIGTILSFYRDVASINTFTFNVSVNKLGGSEITNASYSIDVVNSKSKLFCEIFFQPYFNLEQRKIWNNLMTNTKIFNNSILYRPYDRNFGVQTTPISVLHYDFELLPVTTFYEIFQQNFYRKKYTLSSPKIRYAKVNGEIIYEVVYLDIIDYSVINNTSVPKSIFIDGQQFYPSTFENMRKQLEASGETNPEIRPTHFKTLQEGEIRVDTYLPILILCFALPGKGKSIVDRINNEKIKFNEFDFTVSKVFIKNHYTGNIESINIEQTPRIS